ALALNLRARRTSFSTRFLVLAWIANLAAIACLFHYTTPLPAAQKEVMRHAAAHLSAPGRPATPEEEAEVTDILHAGDLDRFKAFFQGHPHLLRQGLSL